MIYLPVKGSVEWHSVAMTRDELRTVFQPYANTSDSTDFDELLTAMKENPKRDRKRVLIPLPPTPPRHAGPHRVVTKSVGP